MCLFDLARPRHSLWLELHFNSGAFLFFSPFPSNFVPVTVVMVSVASGFKRLGCLQAVTATLLREEYKEHGLWLVAICIEMKLATMFVASAAAIAASAALAKAAAGQAQPACSLLACDDPVMLRWNWEGPMLHAELIGAFQSAPEIAIDMHAGSRPSIRGLASSNGQNRALSELDGGYSMHGESGVHAGRDGEGSRSQNAPMHEHQHNK